MGTGVSVGVGVSVAVSGEYAVVVASGKSLGVALKAVSVGMAVNSGFTNPAVGAAGNSFVLQADNPRIKHNPESQIIQFFKFLIPHLPLQDHPSDGAS